MIGVDPNAISRDAAEVRAYMEDPLVLHGKLPAATLVAMAGLVDSFPARLPSLSLALLAIHGGEDTIVTPQASRFLAEHAGSDDLTLEVYGGLRHELFNELPADRDRVIGDVLAWLEAH
jgi:alpha-beta hydrolase superfamily lysophospholipase